MKEREHNLVVRVDSIELAKLHALAGDADQPISQVVRGWLWKHYAARFGDVTPPTVEPRNSSHVNKRKKHQ